jgi:hypothetical protein
VRLEIERIAVNNSPALGSGWSPSGATVGNGPANFEGDA